MSNTDQAFIDAYRRRQQPAPTSAPQPAAPSSGQQPGAAVDRRAVGRTPRQGPHGPHVRFGGAKAPLSQVLQVREADAGAGADAAATHPPADGSPTAATQLARFSWPGVVSELAAEEPDVFQGLIEGVQRGWPVLGLSGCRPGSGATTTTMALAKLIAAQGSPVAVIDADPARSDLAASLGLVRHPTIAATLAGGLPLAEATIHAVEEGVSLLVAGPITQHPAVVGKMLHELRQAHAAVLIDLGADPRRVVLQPDAVALVHPHDESDAVVEYSCRSLRQSGAALVGAIQTMAPAA